MAKAIHMMVRVLDEQRSLRFYKEVFGLDVAARFDFDGVKELRRDGDMLARYCFLADPDGYKIEILQRHGRYR
jgi:catechol 2,3-dioxygenase-like lactoylglutathione lyase family enzyme